MAISKSTPSVRTKSAPRAALTDQIPESRAQNQQDGLARGLLVCADMCDTLDVDECTVEESVGDEDDGARDGRPQDNAVLRVLGQVLKRGDAAELEGFCAALTEACAWADQSGDMSRFFMKAAKRRVAATAAQS
jgi:hypothetical protein